jgi:hypothetical protein
MCLKHVADSRGNKKLVCIMTKHVDDLKIAGEPAVVMNVLKELEKVFGELKVTWNDFTNCGVHHQQDKITKEITLDQIHYVQNLRVIVHPQLSTGQPEDFAELSLQDLYMSLIGAVAYLAHTRIDILVFVSALQRHTSKPQLMHLKRLNKLLTWIQRNPKKLAYKKLSGGGLKAETTRITHLKQISDAAFKKETEDGYSLRGAVFVRGEGLLAEASVCKAGNNHVVDWVCKTQRHVARSTFAA